MCSINQAMVVFRHPLLFIHLISLNLSSNTFFDPRLEEFVWFETKFRDSYQPQPQECCSELQNLKNKLEEEESMRSEIPDNKTLIWRQKDEIFANYFFVNKFS